MEITGHFHFVIELAARAYGLTPAVLLAPPRSVGPKLQSRYRSSKATCVIALRVASNATFIEIACILYLCRVSGADVYRFYADCCLPQYKSDETFREKTDRVIALASNRPDTPCRASEKGRGCRIEGSEKTKE